MEDTERMEEKREFLEDSELGTRDAIDKAETEEAEKSKQSLEKLNSNVIKEQKFKVDENVEVDMETSEIKSEVISKHEDVEKVVEKNMKGETVNEPSEIKFDGVEEIISGVKWIKSVGVDENMKTVAINKPSETKLDGVEESTSGVKWIKSVGA